VTLGRQHGVATFMRRLLHGAPGARGASCALRKCLAVSLALSSVCLLSACHAPGAGADRARGAQLFAGRLPLSATLQGQVEALPVEASRCINCHAPPDSVSASASASVSGSPSDPLRTFGSPLGAKALTDAVSRRGGPPSRYDEVSLCRAVRLGTDPAQVMLPRAMPRYVMTDADCRVLWAYLTEGA